MDLLHGLAKSPAFYPQNFHPARHEVLFIKMSEQDYRIASFLDDRILTPQKLGNWIPQAAVANALAEGVEARPLHFIFHCGHVGSTLLSRLLDETGNVLPLREPLPLRHLAQAYDAVSRPGAPISEFQLASYREMFLQLWSRGFTSTRTVIAKATSSAARIGHQLLAARAASRAVYLSLAAEPYLATLLTGANSALDLMGHAPERTRRLEIFLGNEITPFATLSPGELAAMSWLAERLTEKKLIAEFGARILPLDFDRMLQDIKATLARVAAHFQLEADAKFFDAIAQSPVLGRYSKAPEYEYSAGMRARILAEARSGKAVEIKKGLTWLKRLGATHENVAALLNEKPA